MLKLYLTKDFFSDTLLSSYLICWEWMGSGVPSGLQNQYEELRASWVGSIPTLSRQNHHINDNIKIKI